MKTRVKFQTILLVLVIFSMAFFSVQSWAFAQGGGGDAQEQPGQVVLGGELTGTGVVAGGPGFIMVSPFSFRPSSPQFNDMWETYNSGIYNSDPSMIDMVAGLTLPHGATLTKMTIYYKDNYASENIYVGLRRGDGMSGSTTLANIWSSGTETAFRYGSVTISGSQVDNQMYSYYLFVRLPGNASDNIVLANVRLDYDYPSYLPTVMK